MVRCGAERFHELLEMEEHHRLALPGQGLLGDAGALEHASPKEIEEELRKAHDLIFEKLPKRTKVVLALPEKDRKKVISERKKGLKAQVKVVSKGSGGAQRKASEGSGWGQLLSHVSEEAEHGAPGVFRVLAASFLELDCLTIWVELSSHVVGYVWVTEI